MDTTSEDSPATGRPPRRTPTEKQLDALVKLDDDALVGRAVDALHALNRRAKEIRDRRNRYRRASFAKALVYDLDDIYALKDRFLDALVLAGRARVESFVVKAESNERTCLFCGRTWFGDEWCRECRDYSGAGIETTNRWFVIDCGDGRRFHQPKVSEAVSAMAVPVPPHDPTQPQREVPKIGLTIAAQRQCIELAIERLRGCNS